jgi:hypothetical protein
MRQSVQDRFCWIARGLLLTAVVLLTAPQAATTNDQFVRTSPRDPRYFELSDGRPYIPIGLNLIAPDSPASGSESEGLKRMEEWMQKLSANGGNYIRVWLSSPFWDVEHERSGDYAEAKAKRIDHLLVIARRQGLRTKMTLEHFRSIDGTPRQRWAHKPLHHISQGGPATNIADFFAGQASRQQFKRKLAWYARRYGNNPTVYGWELWNEINAVSGGDYMSWTKLMLQELRRLFPHNLAMQSLGSFDTARVRDLYCQMSLMPCNDVAQVHRYLDLGAALEICHDPVDVLAADAVREIQACNPGRPIILAESGAVEPRHTGPFKLYAKDKQGIILHDILFAPFFAGAAGPGQCWHWDQYVDRNNLWYHFGRFAAVVRDLDPPAEGFQPILLSHPRLRIYALKGKQTTLCWCRDPGNTWQTELAEGKSPELLGSLRLDLSDALENRQPATVNIYDPWQDRWTPAKLDGSTLVLPDFSRSVFVRLSFSPRG